MGVKNIRLPEDQPRVIQVLKNFIVYSDTRKITKRDINQYPKIHDLEEELDKLWGESFDPREQITTETLQSFPGVKVYDGYEYVIAAVSSVQSLETLGLGTKWCTRRDYPGGSLAKSYLSKSLSGNVYIVYSKENEGGVERLERTYQFEDTFNQFMDEDDRKVYPEEDIIEEIVSMFEHFGYKKPLISLALQKDDMDLINDGLDRNKVEKALEVFLRDENPNRVAWNLAIRYHIENDSFEYISRGDNLDDPLLYSLEVTIQRHVELEEILLNKKERWGRDFSMEIAYNYFHDLVLPNLEDISSDFTDDDLDDKEHPSNQLKLWENFFISYPKETGWQKENAVKCLIDYLLNVKKKDIPAAHPSIKEVPELWKEYREGLIKLGHTPEILNHDYELKEAEV